MKVVRRNSRIHGHGVFATASIQPHETIIEYKGTLRTHEEVDEQYGGHDTGHTFLFTLNERFVLDANNGGNIARWINHGCAPNCKAWVIEAPDGDPRKDKVVIEALRHIAEGEELTYDYGITLEGPLTPAERAAWACHCNAPDCRGTMLHEAEPTDAKMAERPFRVRHSPIHGKGVFATQAIAAGTELIDYAGQLISVEEANELYNDVDKGHTFLFSLDDDRIIDANRGGNEARWFNHSCQPNCIPYLHEDPVDPMKSKVIIETLRDVAPGEELTYDYAISLDMPYTARLKRIWACHCGAPDCSGTLLKPMDHERKTDA